MKAAILISALVFGGFSLLCVLLWIVFDADRYFYFGFSKPDKTQMPSRFQKSSYSDWQFMYWVTRLLLLCSFGIVIAYFL